MEVLLGLGILLTVVTLVGHGIWVGLAWMIRSLAGKESAPDVRRPPRCPRCEFPFDPGHDECPVCRWPAALQPAQARAKAFSRLGLQINSWFRAGVLDVQDVAKFHQSMGVETAPAPAPQTTAAPLRFRTPELPPLPLESAPRVEPLAPPAFPPPIEPRPAETLHELVSRMQEETFSRLPLGAQVAPPTEANEVEAIPVEIVAELVEPAAPTIPIAPPPPPRPAPVRVERLPEPPAPPRRSLGEVLVSFMEEKNIRWGELVGGLLIVSCSIALVISFWSQIAERPVLKYVVFNGVTTALFGAAFYTERRWKLPNTSRGLFLIAGLLVPLNFLAMASFGTTASSVPLPLTLIGEAFALALFGGLLWLAGKSIAPSFATVMSPAILLSALAELLVRHQVAQDPSPTTLLGVAALPVLGMLGTALAVRWRSRSWEPVTETHGHELFRMLGLVSFAALTAATLLIARAGANAETFETLSPLIALFACGPLSIGMLLWRRLKESELTGLRVAGTAVAVAGVMLMFLASFFAWPQPAMMIAVLLVNAVVLMTVARVSEIPAALLPASLCATAAYVIGWYRYRDAFQWRVENAEELLRSFVQAETGVVLVGSALVWGLAAAWRALRSSREEAAYLGASAGISAVLSLGLATLFGFGHVGDPHHVTWIYALYGVAALVAARWVLPELLAAVGSLLLLAASVQGIVFGQYGAFEQPWLMSMLLHGTVFTLLACAAGWWRRLASDGWRDAVTVAAGATTVAATFLAQWGFYDHDAAYVGGQLAWIGALWFALAYLSRTPAVFAVFQATLTQAALALVTGYLQRQPWYQASARPLVDPWTLEAWGVALALCSLFWMACEAFLRRASLRNAKTADDVVQVVTWRERLCELHNVAPRVGDLALGSAVALLVAVATYAILPGVAQELTPRSLAASLAGQAQAQPGTRIVPPLAAFEVLGIPHVHGWGWGAWALFAAAVTGMLVQLRMRLTRAGMVALLAVLGLSCLLISARFEVDVAAASALRWSGAIFLFVISALIWASTPLARIAGRLGWRLDEHPERAQMAGDAWIAALLAMVVPLIGMGVYVAGAAVSERPPELWIGQSALGLLVLFAVAGAVGAILMRVEASEQRTWPRELGRLVTLLGAMPLVVIVLYVVSASLRGNPIVGPNVGSLFERIGLAASYAGPLAIITVTLLGHALWQRSSALALSAGMMLNLSATAGYLLLPRQTGLTLDAVLWVKIAQLNAGVAAGYAIAWIGAAWLYQRRRGAALLEDGYRATQSMLGLVLWGIVLVPSVFLFWWEASLLPIHDEIGSPWGWLSLGLSVAACALQVQTARRTEESPSEGWLRGWAVKSIAQAPLLSLALWTVSVMAAFSVFHVVTVSPTWPAFHSLLVGHVVSAGALLALGLLAVRKQIVTRATAQRVVPSVLLFGFLACAVAIRGSLEDVARPGWWWSLIGVGAVGTMFAITAAFAERRRYLYFASLCTCIVAATLFNSPANTLPLTGTTQRFEAFAWFQVLALALPATLWLWIERRYIAANTLGRRQSFPLGAHRFVAGAAAVLFSWTVMTGLEADVVGRPLVVVMWLGWLAYAAMMVAVAANLWDPRFKRGAFDLYVEGLFGVAFAMDCFNLPLKWLVFLAAVLGAAYGIATSYLWSRREGWKILARRVGIPLDAQQPWDSLAWLVPGNCLLIVGVLALVGDIVFTFNELSLRLLAAKAAWFQVAALAFLTRGAELNRLRTATLALGVVGGVLWGWAWLAPGQHSLLDRGVVLMGALAGSGVVYGFALTKFFAAENRWALVGKTLTPYLIGGAVLTLGGLLGAETSTFLIGETVAIAPWGITAIAVTLVGLVVAALVAAVVPGRDPLGLSERGRQAYVYGAEGLLAATFLHFRVSMPWLFGERFQQFWPLIVMGIAFVGVGLGEWFRRRQHNVLSEPLERSGALLPLLPVLGFWMVDSGTNYSFLLVVVGGLYAALAVLRKSFGFGVLAALAVNGALWYFLHEQPQLKFFQHPQVWLIPPAICVLAATYLNRSRLNPAQLTQLRYGCAMMIYVSSTADIFVNGMDKAPWLAFVLAGISILGVMAGIVLRVRAFLYLGTSFLCVSLGCMIYHAAANMHMHWILYACGIALGVMIIAAFAVMEKKRTEFQHVLERLREWEA